MSSRPSWVRAQLSARRSSLRPAGRVERRPISGLSSVVAIVVMLYGCGSPEARSNDEDQVRREGRTVTEERPCAPYANRWPRLVGGGPTDGPVLLAVGEAAHAGLPTTATADGHLMAKLLLVVDAEPGTKVVMRATSVNGGHLRFTHATGDGPSWNTARTKPAFALPPGTRGSRPVDVPGIALADRADDYRIIVSIADEDFGPFCVRLA